MVQATTKTKDVQRSAWLYLRISQDDANDQLGVARQEKALRQLAADHGCRVVGVFTDNDTSAFKTRLRPGYDALLAAVQPGDVILCTEVTRLTRRMRQLEDLIELAETKGVGIHALRAGLLDLNTSGGRAQARVFGAMAQMESEQMGERVKAKQAQSAAEGLPAGRRMYGFDIPVKGQLVVNDDEAEHVRFMRDWVLSGRSLNSLVYDLNNRGVSSTAGGRWHVNSLKRVLINPKLAGLRTYKGEVVGEGQWEAIISREDHERLTAALRGMPQGARPRVSVFTGVLRCARCGALMQRQAHKRGHDYQCKKNRGCGGVSIKGDVVDDYLIELLIGQASKTDLSAARKRAAGSDGTLLAKGLADDEQTLIELADDFAAGRITRAEWLVIRQSVADRIQTTKAQLAALNTRVPPAEVTDNLTPDLWDTLTLDQKRDIVVLFFERVEIAKGRPGVRDFSRDALASRINVEWKV